MRRASLAIPGAALAALLALAACGPDAPAAPVPPDVRARPNVLLVVLDTTRADHTSLLGYGRPTTPSLEALAREAVNFREAWVPAGWTGPSHASLFTGLRPAHHGFLEQVRSVLAPDAHTLAETLGAAGWKTACISNNPVVAADYGLSQGFAFVPRIAYERDRPRPHCRDAHQRALRYLLDARAAGGAAFVYVNDMEPHLPYDPPEDVQSRFLTGPAQAPLLSAARQWNNPAVLEMLAGLRSEDPQLLRLLPDLYDAEVAGLDAEFGAFVEELRHHGLLDDTLLVVTSDHGENLGDHGLWDHRFSLHRSIRHVPLVVRYPGGEGGGRVVDALVRSEDVFPTVLEVCGLPVPDGLDGASLRGDVSGRISRASWGPQLPVLGGLKQRHANVDPAPFLRTQRAVFDGRHHLILGSDDSVELYDVGADPGETRNLATELPAVVEDLRGRLDPR